MCHLVSSKITTDVQEAINFFVTASQFGVANCMQGIRLMLNLVMDDEVVLREAMVTAYRTIYLSPGTQNRG